MKKILSAIIVFLIFFVGLCSSYIEDKVFCTLGKNSITVTLEKDNNYKCSEYLSFLSQTINTEYNDILSIQKLIKQGYDIDYWNQIYENKRNNLKKMLVIKGQIESAVAVFDTNMFEKMKDYVIYTVSPYQIKYKRAINYFNNYVAQGGKISNDLKKKLDCLQEDVLVIDKIFEATGYDILMNNFNRHLYLKKQIEGK